MQIRQGQILISTTVSGEDMFEQSVVLIAEENETGYVGFIVNKFFPRMLNELQEFRNGKALRLFTGGPVDTDHIFFIHCRPDLIEGGTRIVKNIYLGGDFAQATNCINDGTLDESGIKVFIGYCGWDVQQLQDEIESGWWYIFDSHQTADILFAADNSLWSELYNQRI